jgi:hypothetical protein
VRKKHAFSLPCILFLFLVAGNDIRKCFPKKEINSEIRIPHFSVDGSLDLNNWLRN